MDVAIFCGLRLPNSNKIMYKMLKSNNIHQTYSNELLKWNYGLWFWIYEKIQMHFSISFHLRMSYRDSICDTC
jgi:hypothetical protein